MVSSDLGVGGELLVEAAPPEALVLYTDGGHRDEAHVRALFAARSEDEVRRIVQEAAAREREDATALVLRFGPQLAAYKPGNP